MTTTLTAGAPAPGTPPRTALRRHSALEMAIGLVVAREAKRTLRVSPLS
jgi:hypothetical protein